MKTLPDDVAKYKTTKIFDQNSIPHGLLKNHRTMPGVWGKITVVQGKLQYTIEDNDSYILDIATNGVIEPRILHCIKPATPEIEFFLEFYKNCV